MDKIQKELVKVINSYFGCDAAYFDVDAFTLAKRIMEAGWEKPVRCKDCQHRENLLGEMCCPYYEDLPVEDNHFCSYGERKDNERKAD